MNVHASVGAGKYREPYKIREFLAKNDLNMSKIARELKMNSSTVSHTVRGTKNNKRVLNHLKKIGCPSEFLGLAKKEN